MKSLDAMQSRQGIYIVVTRHVFIFVEVDDAGRVFQLEPHSGTYARDGELRPGGWNVEQIHEIHGPFARAAPPVPAPPPAKRRRRARPPAAASTARRPQDDEAFEGMDQDAP